LFGIPPWQVVCPALKRFVFWEEYLNGGADKHPAGCGAGLGKKWVWRSEISLMKKMKTVEGEVLTDTVA